MKEMSISEIKASIVKMHNSQEYLQLINYYSTESFFKTLGISREEKVHSNFLAWLLSPQSNHKLGLMPILKFLQAIALVHEEQQNSNVEISEELLNDFLIGIKELTYDCIVQTEVTTGKIRGYKREGRIDIQLLIKFNDSTKIIPILIENKVLSKENTGDDENQTEKYLAWATDTYDDKSKFYDPIFIFLAPDYENDIECKSDNFLKMSYQHLVNYVIEPCYLLSSNPQVNYIIENYLRCLSNSSLNETNNRKERRIMAFSKNEKELLEKFYTANKNLFDNVFGVLSNDDDMSKEEREKIKAAFQKIESGRDYSKYLFEGNLYSKRRCVLAIVNYVIEKHKVRDFKMLLELFPDSLQKPGSSGVVQKLIDVRDKTRYFSKKENIINLNDEEIVVTNQWGADNFPVFLDYVEKEFSIKVQKQ